MQVHHVFFRLDGGEELARKSKSDDCVVRPRTTESHDLGPTFSTYVIVSPNNVGGNLLQALGDCQDGKLGKRCVGHSQKQQVGNTSATLAESTVASWARVHFLGELAGVVTSQARDLRGKEQKHG